MTSLGSTRETRGWLQVLLIMVCFASTTKPARADAIDAVGYAVAGVGVELLVPDLGVIISETPVRLVLAWPIEVEVNRKRRRGAYLFRPFVEPQYIPADPEWRGILGGRIYGTVLPLGSARLMVNAEVAGVLATDGTGGAVGGGLGMYFMRRRVGFPTVRYRYFLVAHPRHEVYFDLVSIAF